MRPNAVTAMTEPKVRFERTTDLGLVREILTLPSIWRHIGDDNAPPVEQYSPPNHPDIWYVLAFAGDECIGVFCLFPENSITWCIHTALLPAAIAVKGRTIAAARGVIAWIWQNSPCRKIVTRVPSCNPLALRFARRAEMIEEGRITRSWLKHGELHDQVLLGISKPEVI